jgi:putative DNA primase/helicase
VKISQEVPVLLVEEVKSGYIRGWRFTPVKGKRPMRKGWSRETPADLDETVKWATDGDVGIRTGQVSGVVVVDVDQPTIPHWLPATVTAQTPGGGFHLYFKAPDHPVKNAVRFASGCDIRADGGQCVYPGSAQGAYRWLTGHAPSDIDLAPWPDSIIPTASDSYATKALRSEIEAVSTATRGTRNNTLNKAAFALGQFIGAGRLDRSVAETALLRATDLDIEEAERTIASGIADGMQQPRGELKTQAENKPPLMATAETLYMLTDSGNAERIVDAYPCELRWSVHLGWYHWTGVKYKEDTTNHVARLCKTSARTMRRVARQLGKDETKAEYADALEKWSKKSENTQSINNTITALTRHHDVVVDTDDFDRDPYLLNTVNGTLDLLRMEFRDHRQSDMLTKSCHLDVEYDESATCPHWDEFLQVTFDSDMDLIYYIQTAIGYSCTGVIRDRVVHFLYGSGRNGKSVFMNVIEWLLGSYAVVPPDGMLLQRRNEPHPNEYVPLKGARFACTSEVAEGKRLDEEKFKRLTGNDTISARKMRGEFFPIRPSHKLWIACNHKPEIRGQDHGVWDRIRIIPFNYRVPDEQVDMRLLDKLKAEGSGILNWCVDGVRGWREQDEQLEPPATVTEAVSDYRAESDIIGDWLESCTTVDSTAVTPFTLVYESYHDWCRKYGYMPLGKIRLSKSLDSRNVKTDKRGGTKYVIGLKINYGV